MPPDAGRMPDLADRARHAALSGQHQLSPAVNLLLGRWDVEAGYKHKLSEHSHK